MYTSSWRWRLAAIGAIALIALIGWSVRLSRGSILASPVRAAAAPEGEKSHYVGARVCARCHREPQAFDDPDYVLLTEYKKWKEEDKHSQAYEVLTTERSRQMGRILGWQVETDGRCLNCHAANVPKELQRNDFDIRDGVSCDACHGPASQWILPHMEKKWRTTAIAAKEALGMRDVRDPVQLARLCVSCHIGNVAEGKLVTHDMYAAGHPPLPSIEIASFCDSMPPHWRYLRQKAPSIQQQLRAAYKIPKDEQEKTKRTVLGAVVAFQASLELLADPPEAARKKERVEHWPELANYDCYACHHELKSPSWRQKRGYAGRPGRPPMHGWPTILLEDALRYANDPVLTKQYEERLHKLRQAFDVRPFGDPKEIAEGAAQLKEWSDRLLKCLQESRYDPPAAQRLLRGMCAAKETDKYDYNSARQKVWAIDVILREREPKEEVLKQLAALRQQLKLDLPSGTRKQILQELPEGLRTLNEYDPRKFKSSLDKLYPLLPRE
jgi:hypothetical protein